MKSNLSHNEENISDSKYTDEKIMKIYIIDKYTLNNQEKISPTDSGKYKTFEDENYNEEKKSESQFLEGVPIIDQIFEKQGYSFNTIKIILIAFLVLCVEGLHMSLFSSMIIPLKYFYNLTEGLVGLISSTIFLGVGLGSFLSGWASSKFGRPFLINAFLLIIYTTTLISSFSDSVLLFSIFRLVIGFGLGLIVPISLNLLTEYLPIRYRSLTLTSVWIGFGVGNLYLLIIIYYIMPNYEHTEVKTTFFLSSFLPLFTFIFCFMYLEDSPRNLILHNQINEAFKILENLNGNQKFSPPIKARIIYETKKGNMNSDNKISSNEGESSIWEIFKGKYQLLTILLTVVWCLDSVISYGTGLISSLTLRTLGMVEKFDTSKIILQQVTITIISSAGNFLGGFLSEIQIFGRNRTTIINFIISAIFIILIPILSKYYTLMFSLAQFFWCIAMNVNTTYTCEVYPTHLRDRAVGFLFFATRVGGFLSQFLFIYFNQMGMWVPYHIAAVLLIINALLTFLMPFETFGKPLDTNNHETNTSDTSHTTYQI
jgi:MFS family permease